MHKKSVFHTVRERATASSRVRLGGVLLVVGLFALVGFMLIKISGAATYSAASETESGQRSGNATIDTAAIGASGGQAVKFAAGLGNGNTDGNGEPADSIGYCPTDTTGNVTPPANAGLIWSDEFNGNSVSYAADGGTWRTNGYEAGVGPGGGYNDFAASNRNVSAAESKKYGFATVNKGTLTLKAKRAVDVPGAFADGKRWLGVYLVTDNNKNLTWRYGYFEWRMRDPVKSRGMFPTLFMFNNVPNRHDGYEGAEMDMIEIFGDARGYPWFAGVHFNPSKLNGKEGGVTWQPRTVLLTKRPTGIATQLSGRLLL